MFNQTIKIGNRKIGKNEKVFMVAELSANHNHDFNVAVKTLKAMKESGADAVKIQTYTADTMTIDACNKYFRIKNGSLWDGKTLYELYKEASTPWDWQPKLKKAADKLGLIFFSTPFDRSAADFLEKIGVPAYKIASFEANDPDFIEYVASKRKPVFISNGMSTFEEVGLAVNTCQKAGNRNLILLKCTSEYPASLENVHLHKMALLRNKFQTLVGLSDHTLGVSVSLAGAALGAVAVERHFILDKKIGGPDAPFSLEPHEFRNLVNGIREIEKALGPTDAKWTVSFPPNKTFTRSIFAIADISKGDYFTNGNIGIIRPGFGLEPKYYQKLIGKKAKESIQRGIPLRLKDL